MKKWRLKEINYLLRIIQSAKSELKFVFIIICNEWTSHVATSFLTLNNHVLVLCDNLARWDWVGDGKEVQEGGNICVPVADSC